MSDDNFIFEPGDRVKFEGFAHPFKGMVLGSLTGQGKKLYYVISKEGEVRIFASAALSKQGDA